ncbi:MAG: tyrosine-type recombinase/integrase [Sulfurimicrobium sp.]|nr:tyrosine-type recombinase/integrase [Sulfurimicrobium sp.]
MSGQIFPESGKLCDPYYGLLDSHITAFSLSLSEKGFRQATLKSKLQVIRNFHRWLIQKCLTLGSINEETVNVFFAECQRAGHVRRGDHSVMLRLLKFLREKGVTPNLPPQIIDNECSLENKFLSFLKSERGLSTATLRTYLPVAQLFLKERFGSGSLKLGEVTPTDVTSFVYRHARKLSPRRTQLMGTALRSFLRFLHLRGETLTNLSNCVLPVAEWRLSNIPKGLDPEDVDKLLADSKRFTEVGIRDHAVLLLLARLGLRAGEIVAMMLDDVDWDSGVLMVRGKGSRRDCLPIPHDVGEALATYLRLSRPHCSLRKFFIRARAPHQGFSGSAAIDNIIRRALVLAKLNPSRKGAHLLRHSLAIRMLGNGASLGEIGEILRHSHPNTTEIYAKVNLRALSAIAQPWPGGEV